MKKVLLLICLIIVVPFLALGQNIYPRNVSTNGPVNTVVKDGKTVYIGGNFNLAGYYTGGAALLADSTGLPDGDFPVTNGPIQAVVSDGAGGWFLGGNFTQVGTIQRYFLAHLLADKTVDPNWNPGANQAVYTLAVSGNTVYAGGAFTQIGGQARSYLAALNKSDGQVTDWNPAPNNSIFEIFLSGPTLYVGGSFTQIAGKDQRYFTGIDVGTGALRQTRSVNNAVYQMAQDGNNLYLGGAFSTAGYYAGRAALLPAGSNQPDADFPATNGSIYVTLPDGEGGWYLGGTFTQVGTAGRNYLAHILADKTVDPNWNPGANGYVETLFISGNTLYAGGNFTQIGGQDRNYLAALNKIDGSVTDWNPGADRAVKTLVVSGNTVYAGGQFNQMAGKGQPHFAKINVATGAVEQSISVNGQVNSLVQDGDQLYVGGAFSTAGYYAGRAALLSPNSDLPDFDFPVMNGSITAAIPDGAGGWYIGGNFTRVGTATRNRLAHILADKTLDPAWAPDANGNVQALVLSGNTVYAGGYFTQVGGQARSNLAAFDKNDGSIAAWDPAPNGTVNAMALQGSTLYVGGHFTEIAGKELRYFAPIDVTTGAARPGLGVNVNGQVMTMAQDGNTLYLGGSFSTAGYYTGKGALLAVDTGLPDADFPIANGSIYAVVSDGEGGWYIGGNFTQVGKLPRSRLAHLLADKTVDPNWAPVANNAVYTLAVKGNTVYAGGVFTQVGGQSRNYLAALNKSDGSLADWNPAPNNYINAIVLSDSLLYAGGSFTSIAGQQRNYLASLTLADGTLTAWSPQPNSSINTLHLDGAILYIGGSFSTFNSQNQPYIAAINTAGNQLTAFNPRPNSTVTELAVSDNTVYIGGSFTHIGNIPRGYLAGFNKADGSLTDWNPQANNPVNALAWSGSTLYVGGQFSQLGQQPRSRLAAFNTTDHSLSAWAPQPNGTVHVLAVSGTNILVGGDFDYLKAEARQNILAFDVPSNQLTPFSSQPNSNVTSLAVGTDAVYMGGHFTHVGNTRRGRLAVLHKADGSLRGWDPQLNNAVLALSLSGTTLYAGGHFTQAGDQPRSRLAAFNTADTSLTAWAPQANGTVHVLATSGTTILTGGDFDYLKAEARQNVLALDVPGNRLTPFNPQPDGSVSVLSVSNTAVYIGGNFTRMGDQPRGRLAAINKADGTLTGWNPQFNSNVAALAWSGTTLYVGGYFTPTADQPRSRLAAFETADHSLTPWAPQPNGTVFTLAVSGTDLVAGGEFDYLQAEARQNLLSLDITSDQLTPFDPRPNGPVTSLAVGTNRIYIGGTFNYVGQAQRSYLAALQKADGSLTDWNPQLNSHPNALQISRDTLYVGGQFSSIDNQERWFLAAFNLLDGSLLNWNPRPDGLVRALHLTSLGVLAGGDFNYFSRVDRRNLLALDVSTGKITDWNPQPSTGSFFDPVVINTISVKGNSVYVGGNFTTIGGQPRNNIAELNKSDGLATNWDPNADDDVSQLLVDGQVVYACGWFTNIGRQARNNLAALNITTGDATNWNPAPEWSQITSLALDQDHLYVGGAFSTIGGQSRANIAAFNRADGAITDWNPQLNSSVTTITPDTAAIYITGYFTTVGEQPRRGIAALNKTDAAPTAWDPGLTGSANTALVYKKNLLLGGSISEAGGSKVGNLALISKTTGKAIEWYPAFNSTVYTTLLIGDTIYAGGSFTEVDNKNRNYLATFKAPPDVVEKQDQRITFENISDKVYGIGSFQLNATASSQLPVTFTVLEGHALIERGNFLRITGVGTVVVQASQPGNISFNPAPDSTRSFCVLPAQPTLVTENTDVCLGTQTYSVADVPGADFTWSVSGGGIVADSGNTAYVEWTTAGAHTLTVTYAGNCGAAGPARTLAVSVTDTPLSGTIANMLPADGNGNLSLPLTFSWQPVEGAISYDLYIWPDSASRPATPFRRDINQINYTIYGGLDYEQVYKWQLVAKRACYQLEGPVQSFRLRYLPDLVATNVQVPATGFSGQSFSVSWEVKNQGQGSTINQQWHDAVYLSADAVFDPAVDIYLGAVANASSLEANNSYAQTGTFTLPQGINNNYYVVVVANAFGGLLELEKNNNTTLSSATSTIELSPPPDLQVIAIIRPSIAFSGQIISLSWMVKNEGAGSTRAAAWIDRIYLSPDTEFNTNAISLGSFYQTSTLNAGDTASHTQSFRLPEGIEDTFYVYIRTDASDQIYEHVFETNNTFRSEGINVRLTPPIDLVVTQVTIPAQGSNGESIPISWTVENQGGSSTEGKSWTDQIYLSAAESFDPKTATLAGSQGRGGVIEPGGSYTGQQHITIPDKITGSYHIFIITDAGNGLFEYTNEANNTTRSSTALAVVSPDLIVSSVTAPAADSAGNTVNIRWVVKNDGPGNVYKSKLTDRILLSASATYNPDAVTELKRQTYETNTVSAGGEITRETSAKLPDGISGTYYVYVFTDFLNAVYEVTADTNNISAAAAIQVTLGPWADLQVAGVQTIDTATAGAVVPLTFTVTNTGQAATRVSAWSDGVYISGSSTWEPGQATFIRGIDRSQILQNGSSYQVNTSVSLPADIGDSTYYLYVFADGNHAVYEHTDEGNNLRNSNGIYVKKYPPVDLAVTAISAPASGSSGQAIEAQWTVHNQGQAVTLPGFWYDAVYLSQDPEWDRETDLFVKEWKQPGPLAPGSSYAVQQTFHLPDGAVGTFYLLLVTDHTDLNKDADRGNNFKLITDNENNPVTIEVELTPPSDLQVSSFTSPPEGKAGQPVTVTWTTRNAGSGPTGAGAWTDKVYLSRDLVIDGSDPAIGTYSRNGVLEPGNSYSDSLVLTIPIEASGNYILLYETDFTDAIYEHQAEANNTRAANINVVQSPESDLIVSPFIVPPSALAGTAVNIRWKVKNVGQNPATGTMTEAVYLSVDSLKDVNDVLLGIRTGAIALPPQYEASQELTADLQGVSIRDYYVLVHTDVRNNIYESSDTNNVRPSVQKLTVTVPDLPINVLTQADLPNGKEIFYKLEVPENLAGETLQLTMKGDSLNGANELYLRYGEAPNRVLYDYAHSEAYQGNQEIIVPELRQGTYYLIVAGNTPAAQSQSISLLARILEFGILAVNASTGGNTGPVTIQISGSKLGTLTEVRLRANGITIEADSLKIVDPTRVFATFNLQGAALGGYDVVARNAGGEETDLKQGFEIVAGTASNLVTNVVAPPSTRPSSVISLTVQFTNAGNTDLINPVLQLSSLAGAPIGFTVADLANNTRQLALPLQELNGPVGILRPGATGTIIVYARATTALSFTLLQPLSK